MIARWVDGGNPCCPGFDLGDPTYGEIWGALHELSQIIMENNITLTVYDARALVANCLGTISVRPPINADAPVVVLGTIESRMQTADVVILTGLNDGMFPARGYENAWLPRRVADKIGLPSPDRKVSLMALDFMNLSCGQNVYWLRSRTAGTTQTIESRFLSRVRVARRGDIPRAPDLVDTVMARDNVAPHSLDYTPPTPPADFSDVYVTELELLVHNPYAFYAKHILRLIPQDDYWVGADMRKFGTLVHAVIENATDFSPEKLVTDLDRHAAMEIGRDSVLYHFWHRRFMEMAPVIRDALAHRQNAHAEIAGSVQIGARTVRAKADRIWPDTVMDIKTGAAPTKTQLLAGTMPQLPLEALMLIQGGFSIYPPTAKTPVIQFLQLRNRDCCLIEYRDDVAAAMINAAHDKMAQLFAQYGQDGAPYPYLETGNAKYNAWDDLGRPDD